MTDDRITLGNALSLLLDELRPMGHTYGPELCTIGEARPMGGGANTMRWDCRKCRLAWIAAALDGESRPINPHRQVALAREAAQQFDEPMLAIAAGVLNARITPDVTALLAESGDR